MKIYLIIFIIMFGACAKGPQSLSDRTNILDYDLTVDDRLSKDMRAPIIIVGTVAKVQEIGEPRRSLGAPKFFTQETVILILVENVIRGHIGEKSLEVVFFAFSRKSEKALRRSMYLPYTGERRLFFLEKDGAVYRTIGDVNDYTLRVRSGPVQEGSCGNKSDGCCIAEILLRPPPDELIRGFLYDLSELTYASAKLCSPQTARESVLQLAQHKDEDVRAAAKDMLWMLGQWFPHASNSGP